MSLGACLALVAACDAYDEGELEHHVRAAASSGAGGAREADAGHAPPTPPQTQTNDGDVTATTCGDGKVSLTEKCDIAIPAEQPGACPTQCPPIADCVSRMLNGSNCDAECVVLSQLCHEGDGCCPSTCSNANDADCSQRCGDGVVQESEGETCEPDVDAGTECPAQADCEDGDPCTLDLLVGSERNCNAACSRSPITAFDSSDGCCPNGGNANTDGDCSALCGNSVREPGEECDGSLGCDACQLTLTTRQISCLEMVQETGNDCDRCACMQCTEQVLDCVDSGDATRDMHCATVLSCANDNDCARDACYCATPVCIIPGPCRTQIDAAAISDPSGAPVPAQREDPNTAIGKAVRTSDCTTTNCADVCP